MIGSSMFIFSVSALIYSVSPARAENVFKAKSNSVGGTYAYVVVNGVVYAGNTSEGEYTRWNECAYKPWK